jgi:hypothetical protein
MDRAIITVHLPTHRRASLEAYGESPRQVGEVYDQHIGRYVEFLRQKAREEGFRIETDNKDLDPVYSIEERDREQKKAAHDWLRGQPDLWEWIT